LPPSVTPFTYFQALETSATLPAEDVDGPGGDLLLDGKSSPCHLPGGGGPMLLAMMGKGLLRRRPSGAQHFHIACQGEAEDMLHEDSRAF